MASGISLEGRRLVVTGASSGIGAATVRSLAQSGACVAMLARRKELLDELRKELGDRVTGIPCDVTDFDGLKVAVDGAAKALGGLDGVVCVAGRSMVGTIATGSPQGWRELLDLNLIAPLAAARYAMEHFPTEGRRDVVVVGSTGAILPLPGVGMYGASKRGLRAACDSMRLELASSDINVSLIMPGAFETEGMIGAMVVNGEMPPMDVPMFADGGIPGAPQSVADSIAFALSLPAGVCINELVIRPTRQLNP